MSDEQPRGSTESQPRTVSPKETDANTCPSSMTSLSALDNGRSTLPQQYYQAVADEISRLPKNRLGPRPLFTSAYAWPLNVLETRPVFHASSRRLQEEAKMARERRAALDILGKPSELDSQASPCSDSDPPSLVPELSSDELVSIREQAQEIERVFEARQKVTDEIESVIRQMRECDDPEERSRLTRSISLKLQILAVQLKLEADADSA